MSATFSAQNKRETTGLIDAIQCTDELLRLLDHLERASARQVLDKIDQVMPPGEDRAAVRRRLLDVLAWYKAEIVKWVESSSIEPTESEISTPHSTSN